jgi:uncharacterized membrane protein YfcA
MEYVAAATLGFLGGMLGGLVGVGGGVLFVPALVIFLDQTQVGAEATSLFAIVFVAAMGAHRQRAYGNVRMRDAVVVGVISAAGVAGGVVLANAISGRALELLFAGMAVVIAGQLVVRALRRPPSPPAATGRAPGRP